MAAGSLDASRDRILAARQERNEQVRRGSLQGRETVQETDESISLKQGRPEEGGLSVGEEEETKRAAPVQRDGVLRQSAREGGANPTVKSAAPKKRTVASVRQELREYLAENPDAAAGINPEDLAALDKRTLDTMSLDELTALHEKVMKIRADGIRELEMKKAQHQEHGIEGRKLGHGETKLSRGDYEKLPEDFKARAWAGYWPRARKPKPQGTSAA
ncbi:MAG: hypothetical protein LBC93_00385 [Synergistaceae bacterium]|nr:hypothetical protein [Synergistaceae bacterium]